MVPKTIIVTGASRGVGLAISKYLLTSTPANNLVILARSTEPLQALKAQFPDNVEYIAGDLTDHSLGEKAVVLAKSHFGRLDGLVLNHGVLGQVSTVAKAEVQQWKAGFEVNFFSLVSFTKAALPALRESKGKIIFTSSGVAISAIGGFSLYGATKAAMNHFTLSLANEEPDITAIAVMPGMVDTDMQREIRQDHLDNMPYETVSMFIEAHRDGKLRKPEQPGHVMAKLVLDAPRTLSGRFITWNDKDLGAFQE